MRGAKVRIYDLNGSFIKEFGSGGMGAGEFNQPLVYPLLPTEIYG